MESKITSFLSFTCCFMFFSFLAFHYAYVKSPEQGRALASSAKEMPRPVYDASFKL